MLSLPASLVEEDTVVGNAYSKYKELFVATELVDPLLINTRISDDVVFVPIARTFKKSTRDPLALAENTVYTVPVPSYNELEAEMVAHCISGVSGKIGLVFCAMY
jgi:hypothetical protein